MRAFFLFALEVFLRMTQSLQYSEIMSWTSIAPGIARYLVFSVCVSWDSEVIMYSDGRLFRGHYFRPLTFGQSQNMYHLP